MSDMLGLVIGVVVGGVACLALTIIVAIVIVRKRAARRGQESEHIQLVGKRLFFSISLSFH
jgi:hypothetical protein